MRKLPLVLTGFAIATGLGACKNNPSVNPRLNNNSDRTSRPAVTSSPYPQSNQQQGTNDQFSSQVRQAPARGTNQRSQHRQDSIKNKTTK